MQVIKRSTFSGRSFVRSHIGSIDLSPVELALGAGAVLKLAHPDGWCTVWHLPCHLRIRALFARMSLASLVSADVLPLVARPGVSSLPFAQIVHELTNEVRLVVVLNASLAVKHPIFAPGACECAILNFDRTLADEFTGADLVVVGC